MVGAPYDPETRVAVRVSPLFSNKPSVGPLFDWGEGAPMAGAPSCSPPLWPQVQNCFAPRLRQASGAPRVCGAGTAGPGAGQNLAPYLHCPCTQCPFIIIVIKLLYVHLNKMRTLATGAC